ncbi:hypothetical protein SDC9_141287 [bioreactor metagenome]|uniref:Uncharacterized protein n=1 Tax=bioreactor metagenome TaxID=1076179 RepID=A0A645DX87_9ZZZZ
MNSARDYEQLLQNIAFNLFNALNYSSLIDVLKTGHYNISMGENDVQNLICMENAAPKPRLIRSAGALYVVLLLLAIGSIAAANALEEHLRIPREYSQIALYALLLGAGLYIYRFRLTSFRYTLTDRYFSIDRLTGRSEKAEERLLLSDITYIGVFTPDEGFGIRWGAIRNRSILPVKKSTAIRYRENGEERNLLISPGEEMLEKLTAQWENAVQTDTE